MLLPLLYHYYPIIFVLFLLCIWLIWHRDLRPDHLYLTNDSLNAEVKIVNFTSAIALTQMRETPQLAHADVSFYRYPYTSPELLQRFVYDASTDLWSYGVILSYLLVGHSPLQSEWMPMSCDRPEDLLNLTTLPLWSSVSEEAKDLVSRCVLYQPAARITANDALHHPWFALSEQELEETSLRDARDAMRRYQIRKKFRVYLNVLLLIIRIQRQLKIQAKRAEQETRRAEQAQREEEEEEEAQAIEQEEWRNCVIS